MQPEPADTPQEDIHVTHNRKQRHAAVEPNMTARKATSADFLPRGAPTVAPAEKHDTGVSHPQTEDERGPRTPASQPVSVISVIRKDTPAPQIPTVEQLAISSPTLPTLYNKHGRLIMPAALKGSHEILVHQNYMANLDGLDRVQDDEDLIRMRETRLLVPFPQAAGLQTDERLPVNRRYTRPWTAQFLTALARDHYARFHTPLQINSGVRTVEFQQKLMRTNGNAAPAEGETASPHLTGQAVDLAKKGLSLSEIAWLRGYLLPLVQEGKVDVEEEFQQACFHVSVYKKYLPQAPVKRSIVQAPPLAASSLASALR